MDKVKRLVKAFQTGVISQDELTSALARQCSQETILLAYEQGVIDFDTCNKACQKR